MGLFRKTPEEKFWKAEELKRKKKYEKAIQLYVEAGQEGYGKGWYEAGWLETSDSEKRISYFKRALEMGVDEAAFALACCYEDRDEQTYLSYMRMAAQKSSDIGFKLAQYLYEHKIGKENGYEEAVSYAEAAAENKLGARRFCVDRYYERGPEWAEQAAMHMEKCLSAQKVKDQTDIMFYREILNTVIQASSGEKKQEWEKKLANAPQTDYEEGLMTFRERFLPDYVKALKILTPYADKGYPEALWAVGKMLWEGGPRGGFEWNRVTMDRKRARPYLMRLQELAQEEKDPLTAKYYAEMLSCGIGVDADKEKAFLWTEKAALLGDPESQYIMACSKPGVSGVTDWMKRAAENGHPEAVRMLSVQEDKLLERAWEAIRSGKGKEAVSLYQQAIEEGSGQAARKLGNLYAEGAGDLQADGQMAVESYRKGLELGDSQAVYELAVLYEKGRFVTEDKEKSRELYRQAAEAGCPDAMKILGEWHEQGLGVEKDLEKSIQWYTKAGEAGNEDACLQAVRCYFDQGKGGQAMSCAWQYVKNICFDLNALEKSKMKEIIQLSDSDTMTEFSFRTGRFLFRMGCQYRLRHLYAGNCLNAAQKLLDQAGQYVDRLKILAMLKYREDDRALAIYYFHRYIQNLEPGEMISFGHLPYTYYKEPRNADYEYLDPVYWRVLETGEDQALLISEQGLLYSREYDWKNVQKTVKEFVSDIEMPFLLERRNLTVEEYKRYAAQQQDLITSPDARLSASVTEADRCGVNVSVDIEKKEVSYHASRGMQGEEMYYALTGDAPRSWWLEDGWVVCDGRLYEPGEFVGTDSNRLMPLWRPVIRIGVDMRML